MNAYEKIQELFTNFQESKVRYRTYKYKGKGRPRKSDYIIIKRKDLLDYQLFEVFNSGFTTNYT